MLCTPMITGTTAPHTAAVVCNIKCFCMSSSALYWLPIATRTKPYSCWLCICEMCPHRCSSSTTSNSVPSNDRGTKPHLAINRFHQTFGAGAVNSYASSQLTEKQQTRARCGRSCRAGALRMGRSTSGSYAAAAKRREASGEKELPPSPNLPFPGVRGDIPPDMPGTPGGGDGAIGSGCSSRAIPSSRSWVSSPSSPSSPLALGRGTRARRPIPNSPRRLRGSPRCSP